MDSQAAEMSVTYSTIVSSRSKANPVEDPTMKKEVDAVRFCSLFRFADGYDRFLMILGSIAAAANGAAYPAFSLLGGNMTDTFSSSTSNPDMMVANARKVMWNCLEVGVGVFLASWLMFACWMIAGERQAIHCRKVYLKALLSQQIGWFDRVNQTELSSKFSSQTFAFQGALGEKNSIVIMTIALFISGFIIAYVKGWKMALVMTATMPALIISGIIYMAIIQNKEKKMTAAYSAAGGKAEEAIGAIKTVKFLTGENFEGDKFVNELETAKSTILKYAILSGVGIGFMNFIMLCDYSLGFWFGAKMIAEGELNPDKTPYSAGEVLIVFLSILTGGFGISQLAPCMKKFAEGQQAAAKIFAIIDREPLIREDPDGKTIENLRGVIELKNVTFAYPKDPQRVILKNVSLVFNANQKNALVGESGCGKSTIMQLLMRFYDPQEGAILLDGIDIRQLKLSWLRSHIGYVGQEPVLFATTIKENMLLGNPTASHEDIVRALKQAEAYDFIMDLENKLETYVGHGGGQLSGGQKQRIAIARAILKNPPILLLDEATSALDRKNEILIQITLDKISSERTTISIAHRIKTIMNSDQIFVMHDGMLTERGKFRELTKFKDLHDIKEDTELPVINRRNVSLSDVKLVIEPTANAEHPEQPTKEQKQKKEKKEKEELLKKYKDNIFGRLFKYNKPDMCIMIIGMIAALLNGSIFPIFSLFLARMVEVLTFLQLKLEGTSQQDANMLALVFFILAIAAFIIGTLQIGIFGIVGDRLTNRLRVDCYRKILKMPLPWFDIPKNNAGSLTARLSIDCQQVNGLTSTLIGLTLRNFSCLATGIIIAFVYEWRITLVTLGLIPFMIGAGIIEMNITVGFSEKSDAAYKDSSSIITEAMINIRTVCSFGVENTVALKYQEKLVQPYQLVKKKGNISGLLYGFSQLVMFVVFALIFYIGALFIRNFNIKFVDVFTAIYAIVFAAMTTGSNMQMMPDIASSKNSAANLFEILDSQDEDQLQEKRKSPMIKEGGHNGRIELNNVTFKYPSRNNYTFNNLNLRIPPGAKVAIVGPSGCGKSTITQMILRFYEPESGQITLDGRNIKDYDLKYLRRLFGVVSQEPVLFNASFRDNIQYNRVDITEDGIRLAAQQANALQFIEGNELIDDPNNGLIDPEVQSKTGFDRRVGVKGSHISGGQKQRVAIARSIVREPKILLLDEATAALDAKNEKIVQDSLDKLMINKTTITIAHRFDTIRNSDIIYVFENGCIVEQGNYNELTNNCGAFYRMERGTH